MAAQFGHRCRPVAGCSVATCDVNQETVAQTAALAGAEAAGEARVTGHWCDVCDESQVLRFRDELLDAHARDHVDLVLSNAGIGGGGSFVNSPRQEWERTFAVDWHGVYVCARVFLPLLIASGDGVLVNTSSLNGLWAALGPGMPNTAYAADLARLKLIAPDASVAEVRRTVVRLEAEGKDRALLSAAEAAAIILDGVRSGRWRIIVGKDAAFVDERVRSSPESAYDYASLFADLPADLLAGAKDLPKEIKDQLPDWVRDQLPDD